MLLLTSTSDLIQAVTASGSCTIDVHSSYVDYNGTVVTPGRTNTVQITTATTTAIVGAPGASTQRNVKHISIRNAHASASNAITVQHYDGTTTTTLVKYTLLAGESMQYWDERGWIVFDASGGIKNSPAAGRWISTTIKTSGTTHTTGGSTNTLHAILVGGGGAGGAVNSNNASNSGVGAGGASGGYAEKWFTVSPNTAYTCQIGAGGTVASFPAANAGGTGGQGTNTFFVVGATNVVANGGPGGTAGAGTAGVFLGGALPTTSTSGDINGTGAVGGAGFIVNATQAKGGDGGNSTYGGGGAGAITNSAGGTPVANTGSGGAGGTAIGLNTTVAVGKAGATGVIVIEEYT